MNGMNSIGGPAGATGPTAAEGGGFEQALTDGMVTTSAVLMQFIGGDIIESVMKDETAVD